MKLRGTGPAAELTWDLAERLNLLTGDNGLGKSFLLDMAWRVLTRTWAGQMALLREDASSASIEYQVKGRSVEAKPIELKFDADVQDWKLPQHRPTDPGLVLYARSNGGFAVWDPFRNYYRNAPTQGVVDRERPAAFHFTEAEVWNGLQVGERKPCEGLIRDWVNWQGRKLPEFDRLRAVLETLSTPEEPMVPGEPMRVSIDDGFDVPTVQTRHGRVPLTHASAGMRRVIGLAYLLVWAFNEHVLAAKVARKDPERRMVLLFDEPETHLHPKWQRLLIPALLKATYKLLDDPDQGPPMQVMQAGQIPLHQLPPAPSVQTVVATHSPLVLASLEPLFDTKKDALFELSDVAADGKAGPVELRRLPWQRYGDATGWLTSEVFDMKSARSQEAEQALQQAAVALQQPELGSAQARQLDERLRGLLPDTDPFWLNWRFVAEKRGWLSKDGR